MKQKALYLCRNDTHEAEDLLNDANIKLIAMIQKGQLDENSFGEYFIKTINSLFIDKIRKRKVKTVEFKSEYNYVNHFQNPEVASEKKSINFSELMEMANVSPINQKAFEQFLSGDNMYQYCEDRNINSSTFRGQIRRVKESLYKYRHLFKDFDFDLIIENVLVGKKNRRKKDR